MQGKYLNRTPPKSWSNCHGVFTYLGEVSIYKGEFKNGKADGKGLLENIAGSSYQGGWSEGVFHGFGIVRNSDETIY